jgi:hypothetical protein
MPLILAVNPAGSQSSTLARLARELKECELVGADSYAIAVKAIDQRVPDLVLLPGTDPKGELALQNRLRAVAGGVPTVKLPPPANLDLKRLAGEVRGVLGIVAQPPPQVQHVPVQPLPVEPRPGASPQLIAAATAVVEWVRARQAMWEVPDEDLVPEPAAAAAYAMPASSPSSARFEPPSRFEPAARFEPPAFGAADTWVPPEEPARPSRRSKKTRGPSMSSEQLMAWLPRLAVAALLVTIAATAIRYGSDISALFSAAFSGAPGDQPVEPADGGVDSARSGGPDRGTAAAPADQLRGSGWLAIFSPVDLSVSEGNKPIALDERGRALMAPGAHKLRFRNRALGYDEVRTVQIRPAETTTVNLIPQTTLRVTSSEPAEVSIDGVSIGQTPVVNRRIDLGTHTVVVKSAGAQREFMVEATSKPVQLDADFTKP